MGAASFSAEDFRTRLLTGFDAQGTVGGGVNNIVFILSPGMIRPPRSRVYWEGCTDTRTTMRELVRQNAELVLVARPSSTCAKERRSHEDCHCGTAV